MPTNVPVYAAGGGKVIGHLEREAPVCGQDFCDACGDCLRCYGDDECPDGGAHFWLYYFDALSADDQDAVVMKTPLTTPYARSR